MKKLAVSEQAFWEAWDSFFGTLLTGTVYTGVAILNIGAILLTLSPFIFLLAFIHWMI